MTNTAFKSLFNKNSVNKNFIIQSNDDTVALSNSDMYSESFELTESLCSDTDLTIGSCESSRIKFKIANTVEQLLGKKLTVKIEVNGNTKNPFILGTYKVNSDQPSADRNYRDVVAYDAMYDIINTNVSDWYNGIKFPTTLKAFRDSFFEYMGIEQETVDLINDSMTIEETITPSELSGKIVISAICELNGCFGNIGRDGIFRYVFLQEIGEGTYPSAELYPSNDLFPATGSSEQVGENGTYRSATYEDYKVRKITKLQIRQEEGDIGAISGTGDNCYIVEDNFLVYGKSAEELKEIADKLYSVISTISPYTPAEITLTGNPCIEVGDAILLNTPRKGIETYVMQRTMTGIQALKDVYQSSGEESKKEKVNSTNKQIVQLRGKTNLLIRNVEETREEIKDVEKNLSSKITQTAKTIEAEVKRATGVEEDLSASIKINADSITTEVKRAQGQEVELAAAIKINADNITSKVTKGDVSSEISQEAGKITIKSNRLSIESTNFTLSENGTVTAKNVDLSGKITATSGKIGGFTIGEKSIYSGSQAIGVSGIYIGSDGISSGTNFKVDSSGKITARDCDISGGEIGGFKIGESSIYSQYAVLGKAGVYIGTNGISCGSDFEVSGSTGVLKVRKISYLNTDRIDFYSGVTISSAAVLCGSGKTLGFFGLTGNVKKSVSKITIPSSATASSVATTLNNLLDALKSYNLIG